ncbi:carcinoembryonic antigen-related cell adhesion molecule 5-like [Coregonus clupeaformis]|uniref:carcinoembryonic antigen-related cell adhesion molecule 5-like n=1 Tax=Coregonus clupeaformis TaxID=59861 RepID=UPI001E1C7B09|nr:carcinoembryonic antigen-related cell adhesion molecule 5-like [Coregonus clupeaformis]
METATVVSLTMAVLSGFCHGDLLPAGPLNGALGENITFNVTLSPPEPPKTVTWNVDGGTIIILSGGTETVFGNYKGRVTLSRTTGSLELRNLSLDDSGEYLVNIITAADVSLKKTTRLKVFERVSDVMLTSNDSDILVEFNSSVSLSCSSSGSSPFSYRWLNSSSEVTASDGVQVRDGNSTLTIVRVTRYDQGPYTCIVSNPISSVPSQNVTLTISYGPDRTTMNVTPPDVLYGSGSNLTLSCSAESSPPAQFQWALNGTLLYNRGPELSLEHIQASQSGSYSCWAHNTRTLRYQISEPSDITVLERISNVNIPNPTNLPIIEGNYVTLTCDASGSISTREWMKAGQPLSLSDNILFSEDNKTASINPVKRTDSGIYMIPVSVTFTLTCSADSNPPASYTWMHNETKIPGHSPEFTKENSEYFDSGNYTCTATNYVTGNNTSAVHELSVKAEGSLTPGLSAGAITGIVIGVLLVVGVAVGVAVFFIKKNGTNADPIHRRGSKQPAYENQSPVHENPSPVYENTRQNQSPPLPLTVSKPWSPGMSLHVCILLQSYCNKQDQLA